MVMWKASRSLRLVGTFFGLLVCQAFVFVFVWGEREGILPEKIVPTSSRVRRRPISAGEDDSESEVWDGKPPSQAQ